METGQPIRTWEVEEVEHPNRKQTPAPAPVKAPEKTPAPAPVKTPA